ncbi:thiamine pyrophosphate-binding protein [soil metagenome]
MAEMTGGQAIARTLQSYGVDTIFGLPGVQLDNTFDALYDLQDDIQVLNTRHEQATAYMALGYAQSTGKVGVCLIVPGPGLLNTTAALSTAYATNTPVLALSGQVDSNEIEKGYGSLHEIPQQLRMIQSVTKWAARADSPSEAPELLREAFRQLRTGRPRPGEFEMSPDIMGKVEDVELLDPVNEYEKPAPDEASIVEAARLLGKARKPVIFAGSGVIDYPEQMQQLAEALEAPVVMSPGARGVISDRDYRAQTMLGGRVILEDADVILAIGTRFAMPQMMGGVKPDKHTLIRVDIDEQEADRFGKADLAIVGDAGKTIDALLPEIEKINGSRPSRKDDLEGVRERVNDIFGELQPQWDFSMVMREELPDDGKYVAEITQLGYFAQFGGFPFYEPRTFVHAGYQGTLGFGFATALGVQVGNPDKKVISINGDGGFMYTMPELATAVRHKIPLVAVVFNDGAFGNVKRIQQEMYDGKVMASSLTNPDFVKLAESFGAAGIRATDAGELRAAIREGFANNHPTLIDVPVGEMPSIWQQVFPERFARR